MKKRNQLIRAAKGDIPIWAIAERLKIHESTLLRWFRYELSLVRQKEIITVIEQLREEAIAGDSEIDE
jgi:transposase-like protein